MEVNCAEKSLLEGVTSMHAVLQPSPPQHPLSPTQLYHDSAPLSVPAKHLNDGHIFPVFPPQRNWVKNWKSMWLKRGRMELSALYGLRNAVVSSALAWPEPGQHVGMSLLYLTPTVKPTQDGE